MSRKINKTEKLFSVNDLKFYGININQDKINNNIPGKNEIVQQPQLNNMLFRPTNTLIKNFSPDIDNTLSIDIGVKNLGFSLLLKPNLDLSDFQIIPGKINISFGIFDIEKTISLTAKKVSSTVVQRCFVLQQFLIEIIDKFSVEKVIVERQVPTNTPAMELMYSIISICLTKIPLEKLIIYAPDKKFKDLGLEYNTKNKAHKKLSVEQCKQFLGILCNESLSLFDTYVKQDDISDSILMNLLVNEIIGLGTSSK